MNVHVISDCTLRVGVSNSGPSSYCATKLECMERTRIAEQFNLAAREVRLIWHVLPGASAREIKINCDRANSTISQITIMSMFNDIEWTKKGNTETCLHNAKEVAAFATHVEPGTLGPALENTWRTGNSNEPQGKLDIVALRMGGIFKCHTFNPLYMYISSNKAAVAWKEEERRNKLQFHGTCDNKKRLINTIVASNLLCIYNRICHWYEIEHLVLAHREQQKTKQIDLEPEQLTLIVQETTNNATSSRRHVATTHRESRDADSEKFRTSSTCQNGGKSTMLYHQ